MLNKTIHLLTYSMFLALMLISCVNDIANPNGSGDPFIELISPNGDEVLQVGAPYTIEWEANFSENIDIQFYRGLQSDIIEMEIRDVPNNGQYIITPLVGMSLGENYKVKIISVQNTSLNDVSDTYFEISGYVSDGNNHSSQPSNLYLPHTGDYAIYNSGDIDWYRFYLYEGNKYFFENTSAGGFDSDFYLYNDDTNVGNELVSNDDDGGNAQPYIEYDCNKSGYYYLRVAHYSNNPAKNKQTDTGYYTLTIDSELSADILVYSPNGGEEWVVGTGKYITWGDQNSDYVDIDLYKNGFFDSTIALAYYNSGNYYWYILSDLEADTDYQIRVSNSEDASIYDESDDYFSIIESDYVK